MALDTALKRASAINPGCPWRGVLPLPDASVDETDRPVTLNLYAMSAGAAVVVPDVPQRSAGGRHYGRTWAPEPERPQRSKSQVRKVEKKIEAIAQQPIARIDVAALSMAVQRMLAVEIPDYSEIIYLAQQRIEARKRDRELAAQAALEAEVAAIVLAQRQEAERIAKAEAERIARRKANLAKKRDANKQLIMRMIEWH